MLLDVISIFVIHFYDQISFSSYNMMIPWVVTLIFLHSFSTEENILCQVGLGDVRSLEGFDFEMDMC